MTNEELLEQLNKRFDGVNKRFDGVDKRLNNLEKNQNNIEKKQETLKKQQISMKKELIKEIRSSQEDTINTLTELITTGYIMHDKRITRIEKHLGLPPFTDN